MFIDVGFSNYVEVNKIITVNRPDSSPIRRMISQAKDEGRYVDLTQGKKTRSIIISTNYNELVLIASAVQTATIIGRVQKAKKSGLTEAAAIEQLSIVTIEDTAEIVN